MDHTLPTNTVCSPLDLGHPGVGNVRTTQRTTQSVLALRAPVLRGRTRDRLHTLEEESGKRKYAVNASESRSNRYIALGPDDVDRLSDARVRIQLC